MYIYDETKRKKFSSPHFVWCATFLCKVYEVFLGGFESKIKFLPKNYHSVQVYVPQNIRKICYLHKTSGTHFL